MNVNKTSRNERTKLLANTLNTLGLAFLVPGVVVPIVTLLYGAEPPNLRTGCKFQYGGHCKPLLCILAHKPF